MTPFILSDHQRRLLAGFCTDVLDLAATLPIDEFPDPIPSTLASLLNSFAALRHLLDNPYTPTTTILAQLGT